MLGVELSSSGEEDTGWHFQEGCSSSPMIIHPGGLDIRLPDPRDWMGKMPGKPLLK